MWSGEYLGDASGFVAERDAFAELAEGVDGELGQRGVRAAGDPDVDGGPERHARARGEQGRLQVAVDVATGALRDRLRHQPVDALERRQVLREHRHAVHGGALQRRDVLAAAHDLREVGREHDHEGVPHRLAGRPVAEGVDHRAGPQDQRGEHRLLAAGEVVAERPRRDADRLRDRLGRDRVEPLLQEQVERRLAQRLASGELLALTQSHGGGHGIDYGAILPLWQVFRSATLREEIDTRKSSGPPAGCRRWRAVAGAEEGPPARGEVVARREADRQAEVLELPDVELEAGGVAAEPGGEVGGADAGEPLDDAQRLRRPRPARARPVEPVQAPLEVAAGVGGEVRGRRELVARVRLVDGTDPQPVDRVGVVAAEVGHDVGGGRVPGARRVVRGDVPRPDDVDRVHRDAARGGAVHLAGARLRPPPAAEQHGDLTVADALLPLRSMSTPRS